MAAQGERLDFRWSRGFSAFLFVAEAGFLAGIAGVIVGAIAGESPWVLLICVPVGLAAAFVGVFAFRLRQAHVALLPNGLHVYFPMSMDTGIPFDDISAATIVNHRVFYGLGIRTNLVGHVALATAWGLAAELELRKPVRAGILPYVWWTHARKLRLTVERPEVLVAAVAAKLAQPSEGGKS